MQFARAIFAQALVVCLVVAACYLTALSIMHTAAEYQAVRAELVDLKILEPRR